VSQKETITQKEQTQEPTTTYTRHHLKKVDKTQDPRKVKSKPTVPLANMTRIIKNKM
jgi:hypothetical protein